MKKDHSSPPASGQNSKTKKIGDQKMKNETTNKKNRDNIGTMKIGKAHSMNDDDSISNSTKK
jgi:hypothetical protein